MTVDELRKALEGVDGDLTATFLGEFSYCEITHVYCTNARETTDEELGDYLDTDDVNHCTRIAVIR